NQSRCLSPQFLGEEVKPETQKDRKADKRLLAALKDRRGIEDACANADDGRSEAEQYRARALLGHRRHERPARAAELEDEEDCSGHDDEGACSDARQLNNAKVLAIRNGRRSAQYAR